ncbi:MAG: hypothetical protein AB8G86_20900 [Saprospiraceae bacterium]
MKLKNLIPPLLLLCSITAFSQKVENVMFVDFLAGNKVLKLDIQSNTDYPLLVLGIVKGKEHLAYTVEFNARQGVHYYDLRFLKEWDGQIKFLVTNLDKRIIRRSALVEPTLKEEIDILLDREIFSTKVVNHTKLKTFLGYPLTQLIFFFATFLIIILFFIGKKNLTTAIFISCLAATILLDTRIIIQHFRTVQQIEDKIPYIKPVVEVQRFLEEIRPIIKDGSWTFQPLLIDEYLYLFFKYNLADIPFLRDDLEKYPVGTYIISVFPPDENQKLILSKNSFNLLQQL